MNQGMYMHLGRGEVHHVCRKSTRKQLLTRYLPTWLQYLTSPFSTNFATHTTTYRHRHRQRLTILAVPSIPSGQSSPGQAVEPFKQGTLLALGLKLRVEVRGAP